MHDFITRLPKAELHLHIEGSLEPELMFALAERNGVALPYASIEAVREADQFDDLQSSSPCLLYTSPSPRDRSLSRMPSSA